MTRRRKRTKWVKKLPPVVVKEATDADTTPDWTKKCEVCDATPIVPLTGKCGPCTFGEADTAEGNW